MDREKEIEFHKARIAFMIVDEKVLFLKDSHMAHIEWAKEIGIAEESFPDIVRGYYLAEDLVFYKGDFIYDEETEEKAKKYSKEIKEKLDLKNISVYLGIIKGEIGSIWPPEKFLFNI